jgi:predicted nucleotidyltransferase
MQNNADILKVYGVRKLGIFGSFASSRQTAKSDVDVIVEFKKKRKPWITIWTLRSSLKSYLNGALIW